jgi:threonine synthase
MHYISTRDPDAQALPFDEVVLRGLAPDGGLYVPTAWPRVDMGALAGRPYPAVARAVLAPFVGDAIAPDALARMIDETYAGGAFAHRSVAPLRQLGPDLWLMELFCGPTLAFKDVALQLLGRLFDHILGQRGARATIVGATSGDTGSAAIEGLKGCANVDVFILYPHGRVSEVQRRQMTTVEADNVHCIAVEGTFDDCQAMVKAMFADAAFRDRHALSAVNSINWARIAAQVVYYVAACAALRAPTGFAVPTGNFGNVLAAWVARRMGAPVAALHVATNANDILARFFAGGAMEVAGEVATTLSPSMDIQVSSNFERYLFEALGRDAGALAALMAQFKDTGRFALGADALAAARADFAAHRCDDAGTLEAMRRCYADTGIAIDPHTAVGLSAAYAARAAGQGGPMVALACAHPAKFPDAVERAVGVRPALPPHLADLLERPERATVLPADLARVQGFIGHNARAA